MHSKDVTHNNLQPKKILVGPKISENRLYLVGLRNSRKLIKYNQLMGAANTDDKPLQVTKFSSINVHLGLRKLPTPNPIKKFKNLKI